MGESVGGVRSVVHLGYSREGRHSEGQAQVADAISDGIHAANHDQGWDSGRRMEDEVSSCAGVVGYAMGGA